MIASMLIRQNADAAAGAEQIDDWLESGLAIEQFQARLAARPPNMLVNVRIAKFLINARVSYKPDKVRHQLRKQFPCSQMAQHEHHGNTHAKFAGHRLNIFNRNAFEDLLRRHCREFYAAEQVSPKELKVPAYETTQFARRLFVAKGNRDIALCQPPIFPRSEPRAQAEKLPNTKQKPQRQRGGNGRARAIKKVNDKVEHYGAGSIAVWRRQGKFACGVLQPI